MTTVSVETQNDIALVRMNQGITNAIDPQLVEDLETSILQVKKECRGMVLTGGRKFFSIGFSLPHLMPLDREDFTDFLNRFDRTLLSIYTLPMPTVCAVSGHAVGGGNILALSGDYRYMVQGKKRIGLNEVRLGASVPYLADLILRQIIGDRAATEMLYGGELLSVNDAARIGLVDRMTPEETLEQEAIEKVRNLAQNPRPGFVEIKANRVEAIEQLFKKNGIEKTRKFVDTWFRPETQELLKKAAETF